MEKQTNLFSEEIKSFLNLLQGKHITYTHIIRHPAFENEIKTENQFIIKKIVFGPLKEQSQFQQVMLASTFNNIYVISSIQEIELLPKQIVFYADKEKNIFHRIELLEKEERNHG